MLLGDHIQSWELDKTEIAASNLEEISKSSIPLDTVLLATGLF